MNDYSHLRLHRSRTEQAERHHAVTVGTPDRHTLVVRALRASGAVIGPRRGGSPRAAVRYAGPGVAGEHVE